MVRVVIADDQHMVRAGFRLLLEGQPDIAVVQEAADGLEAVEAAALTQPDVVLMDVQMPRLDGIEATRRVAASPRTRRTRIVMLTTFDLDQYVFEALRAGASGFLLKDAPAERLLEAIRTVAAGEALLAPSVTRRLIEHVARGSTGPAPAPPAELTELTPRERQVLDLLAAGRSNAEIADALVVSEPTVKSHVASVLMKLGLRDRVQAVIYAYESGVVRPGSSARTGQDHPRGP